MALAAVVAEGVATDGKRGPRVAAAAELTGGGDGCSGAQAAPITADATIRTAAGPIVIRDLARPRSITPRYAPGPRVDRPATGLTWRGVGCTPNVRWC